MVSFLPLFVLNNFKIESLRFNLSDLMSFIVRGVCLPLEYQARIGKLNATNLNKGRLIALQVNKLKREEMFKKFHDTNLPLAVGIEDVKTAKIALAILCLGEASKSSSKDSTAAAIRSAFDTKAKAAPNVAVAVLKVALGYLSYFM